MSIAKSRTFLFVTAIVVFQAFQLAVGSVALFVFGGTTAGTGKMALYLPFLSVPILLLAIWKIGTAMPLMWGLFTISHVWYVRISWPKWEAVYVMLKLDWPLLANCILITLLCFYRKTSAPVLDRSEFGEVTNP